MNDEFDRMLSKLVINIALPGMILGSVLTATSCPQAEVNGLCLGLSVASTFVMFAVAYGFTLLLRIPDGHRGVYQFMLCFGNVGFIGYPVLSAIFGPDMRSCTPPCSICPSTSSCSPWALVSHPGY